MTKFGTFVEMVPLTDEVASEFYGFDSVEELEHGLDVDKANLISGSEETFEGGLEVVETVEKHLFVYDRGCPDEVSVWVYKTADEKMWMEEYRYEKVLGLE